MTKATAKKEVVATQEKVNEVLAKENIEKLYEKNKTHSAVIRFLAAKGYKTSDIAKALGKRYQHVRNVLVQDAQKKESA